MKKIIVALAMVITMSQSVVAEWVNALVPEGKGKLIILVKNGKANYRIDDNSCPEAAKFLRRNLELITGVKFSGNALLYITFNKHVPDLGIDGYSIEIKNNNIILKGGSDNGIFNAVTSLLEEDLGWRYYQKDQKTVCPGGEVSRVKVVPRRYSPPFFQRCVYSKWALDPAWAIANKTRKGNFGKYFVHTFFKLIPPGEFGKSNPEFFALDNGKRSTNPKQGQLCMTNKELRHVMAQKIIKVLKANPEMDFIALSQNDNDGYCRCPACSALLKKEKNPSGPLLHFVNAVAAEVYKACPDITIVTEAYRYSLLPPAKVKPAKNVMVRLCFNKRIASWPFFFVSETDDLRILNLWSQKTDRLMVWDYMTNFRHYLIPRADLPVLGKNIKLYRDKKVSGVMMQANHHNKIGTQAAMRAWLCAKLLWNPDLSVEALASDYINGFWGKDIAPWLLKYNTLLINEWQQFHAHNKPGAPFRFSRDFYSTATDLLKKAAVAAKGRPELLEQLEMEKLTLDCYYLANGITKDVDVAAYQLVLDQFANKLKKYNIKLLGEGAHSMTRKRIAQYRDGVRLAKYTKTVPVNHIILPATWNVYTNKGLIADNGSLVGRAMRQDPDGRWSIQWRFEDFSKLIPGKYKVRIRARADKKTSVGHGAFVGVYNVSKATHALKHPIKAQDLDGKKYSWIDCGIFQITPETMYLYTVTTPNKAFNAFYVDAVEFIPVP